MNMTGTISIKDNFSEAIKKAKQTTDKFSKSIDDAKKNIDELKKQKKEIKILVDAKKAQKDIMNMQKSLKDTTGSGIGGKVYTATIKVKDMATSKIKEIGSSLLSLSKTAMLAGSAVAGAGMFYSMRLAGQMEQTRIGMGTLLKDQAAGDAFVKDLSKFAVQTPFEFNDLANNAKFAMAMGFKRDDLLSKDMKSGLMVDVGNAAAGLGNGKEGVENIIRALGQMQAKGKVSAQEINQLAENGVGAWEHIAKAIGKTKAETMKLGEDGLLPADKAIQAIRKGMQTDFAGMMAKQSKTFLGLLSSLKDFANLNIFASLGKGINDGLLPYVTKLVDGLTNSDDALNSWSSRLERAGKTIGDFVGSSGEKLAVFFQKLSDDEKFKNMKLGDKIVFVIEEAFKRVDKWVNGDGKKTIEGMTKTLGTILGASLPILVEELTPVITQIGTALGSGMAKGLKDGFTSSLSKIWVEKKDENDTSLKEMFLGAEPGTKPISQRNKKDITLKEFFFGKNKKASGISYVPRDNYPALLHKGERVVTAVDNKNYNQGGSGIVVNMTNNVNASDPKDVDSFLSKLEDTLYELAGNMPQIPQTSPGGAY